MTVPFSLPASLKKFIAYQEQLIGRSLTNQETEVTAAWLDLFNDVSTGRMDLGTALSQVDGFIRSTQDPALLHFLRSSRCWLLYAGKGATV